MSKNNRTFLVPSYMKQFKCIGPECEDTCCSGWRIDIDKDTFKKYRKVKDNELQKFLSNSVKRNRSNITNFFDYGKIKMDVDNKCPLLTQDKLCTVQTKLGEDYLSNTCSTYPRMFNIFNETIEKSATMSCPEAVRIALLNPEVMAFDYVEESVGVIACQHKVESINRPNINQIEDYFWELRVFTIQLLQNRSYSLPERLIILGMFYRKVETFVSEKQLEQILILIDNYKELIKNKAFDKSLKEIPSQLEVQLKLILALADVQSMSGVYGNRYYECLAECLQGLNYEKNIKNEDELVSRYKDAYREYYEPFMSEYEYIMENYLVNYVFKNMFPLSSEENIFDNFAAMILHFALIKMHLIGIASYNQGLTLEHVVKLIQSFAKVVEHNYKYLKSVMKVLKENNYTTMAYMAILIKN